MNSNIYDQQGIWNNYVCIFASSIKLLLSDILGCAEEDVEPYRSLIQTIVSLQANLEVLRRFLTNDRDGRPVICKIIIRH